MLKKAILLFSFMILLSSVWTTVGAAPKDKVTRAKTVGVAPIIKKAPRTKKQTSIKKQPRKSQIQELEERVSTLEQLVVLLIASNSAPTQQEEETQEPEKEPAMSEAVSFMYR